MTLAILSALADEQQGMLDELRNPVKVVRARRDFWRGKWFGQDVVLALCGIGKVAAATTASTLIESFGVQAIVLTGVAGGLAQGVAVGDVVVARAFLQHDMDASPLFVRYEVPMYGRKTFDCHAGLSRLLVLAAQNAVSGFLPPISVHQGGRVQASGG
jgi:adenosylhomocysteine nucleosidase